MSVKLFTARARSACLLLLLAPALPAGCALVDATLKLERQPVTKMRLTDDPSEFRIGRVLDRRVDPSRIGCKKNGLGSETADIFLDQPLPNWFAKVLSAELAAAGLRPVTTPDRPAIVIDVDLLNFFAEPDVGLSFGIYAIIHAQVTVRFPDGAAYARRFAITDHKSYLTGMESNFREVLQRTIDTWLIQVVPAVVELVRVHRSGRLQASPGWRIAA